MAGLVDDIVTIADDPCVSADGSILPCNVVLKYSKGLHGPSPIPFPYPQVANPFSRKARA